LISIQISEKGDYKKMNERNQRLKAQMISYYRERLGINRGASIAYSDPADLESWEKTLALDESCLEEVQSLSTDEEVQNYYEDHFKRRV